MAAVRRLAFDGEDVEREATTIEHPGGTGHPVDHVVRGDSVVTDRLTVQDA